MTQSSESASTSAPGPGDETGLRWANLIVWALVALLAAVIGILLIPLTTPGGVRLPVAPVVGLVANVALPRFMLAGTGWKWSAYVPAAVWAMCALAGAAPTSGGDLLIPGNSYSSSIGLAYLGVGAMAAIVGIAFASISLQSLRGKQRARAGGRVPRVNRSAD